MLALGSFRFGINSAAYQKLERQSLYRWRPQQRVGRLPAMQFLGEEGQSITLDGVILPQFRGGLGQVKSMKSLAETGRPHLLLDGTGHVWGKFVIVSINTTHEELRQDGTERYINFKLELKEYGGGVL
ncbi:MAG: phage tail protein [Flavobacteriales bacterium]